MNNDAEALIKSEGHSLFQDIKKERDSFFDKQYWLGRIMDFVLKDPSFKVDLFRFVDVLPMLTTSQQIAKHIEEYLLKKERPAPLIMGTALKAFSIPLTRNLAAKTMKKNVSSMAQRFIMGTHIDDARKDLINLLNTGLTFSIDLLGEKTLSDHEADNYFERYRYLIGNIREIIGNETIEKHSDVPNVSIKISALTPFLKEECPHELVKIAKKRVIPLIKLAKQNNVFINFDLENYVSHEVTTLLFKDIIKDSEFDSWPHLGIVCQAYLKDSKSHLEDLINICKKRSAKISIRLVKGAYWDYEVVRAQKLNIRCPVYTDKAQTDLNYEDLTKTMLQNSADIKPCFASHNIRSIAHAICYAKKLGLNKDQYEFQMLYGMGDAEQKALIKRGHNVRIYVPLGEMIPGMSYLVRRLLENTSQMGFVKLSHHDQKDEESLLSRPVVTKEKQQDEPLGFINEEHADFSKPKIREIFKESIDGIIEKLPIIVKPVINGEEKSARDSFERFCPSESNKKVSIIYKATKKDAETAIEHCIKARSKLFSIGLTERIKHLLKLADILKKNRAHLAALINIEVGKTIKKADGDVLEAIDFCRYYAHRAKIQITKQKIGCVASEENILRFIPRGPCVVIAPWNFPLAILTGMSVAPYVCGNSIILKPAEQSSAIAKELYEAMVQAGFLKEAVQFLPGIGEEIGPMLVAHKDVANICFTGSKEVGHEIIKNANTVSHNQTQMKRVVCEMGGKNAIIIDDDADLDEAVDGVIESVFGYAGQRCSAGSRIIILENIYDLFLERLVEAAKSMPFGSAHNFKTFVGPVVDKEAQKRLLSAIDSLKTDSKVDVHFVMDNLNDGYYVPPTIVSLRDNSHWVFRKELFGPIVACLKVENIESALTMANDSEYALTGGFYSRSPKNIAHVKENFNVGNLYINSPCTGSMVNRQPFGGFKMSGTGIKAGGPYYLLNFVDQKVVSENTMRRGFTPEVSV